MEISASIQPNAVTDILLKVRPGSGTQLQKTPMDVPQRSIGNNNLQSSYLTDKISPAFARGLLDQAVSLFLAGEPEAARLILHDLVRTRVGYAELAQLTNRSCANLRVMLSPKGKPGMETLSIIFRAIRDSLNVNFDVRVIQIDSTLNRKTREPRNGLCVVPARAGCVIHQ